MFSTCGRYIAIYHSEKNSVAFYRIQRSGDLFLYVHVEDSEELKDVTFQIQKTTHKSLIGDVLPEGDLIVYLTNGEVRLLKSSVLDFVVKNLEGDCHGIDKLIYTGISEGNMQINEIDFWEDLIEAINYYFGTTSLK